MEITENAARELLALKDIANYARALRDGLTNEPGVPDVVPDIIKEECMILLRQLDEYES